MDSLFGRVPSYKSFSRPKPIENLPRA